MTLVNEPVNKFIKSQNIEHINKSKARDNLKLPH